MYIAFGLASSNRYPKNVKTAERYWPHHNKVSVGHFHREQLEIDILLNVDNCELHLCVVGECEDSKIVKLTNLPKLSTGWVPHFNIFGENDSVRCASMPFEWYGQKRHNIF